MAPRYESLDAALDFLAPFGPELANGFTSHAPMVAEALCALGRPEAVLPWLERTRPQLTPRPAPRAPLGEDGWRDALGRPERTADWMRFMQDQLAEAPWRAVLARFPDYEVDLAGAQRLRTEFVQGFASLPVRIVR